MNSRELPENFKKKMNELLGDETEAYLASFDEPSSQGLRVNTLRLSPQAFEQMALREGWDLSPVLWAAGGYRYSGQLRPARHPWYYAGLYYLQEPSAMAPAAYLPVEPGDRVLDLCAAPGGKSTALAQKLSGRGILLSNDISASRARALLKNLELFGAENFCVSSETPEKLASVFPEYFDKILVDAPCSGEGMFRREPEMVKSYIERGPEYYIPVQRAILAEAVKMLRPGGMLLYSTCTFDRGENEENVLWLLEQFPALNVVPLEKKEGMCDGVGISGPIRLFPHRIKGEGHFLCLFRLDKGAENRDLKSEERDAGQKGMAGKTGQEDAGRKADRGVLLPAMDFLKKIPRSWDPERFYLEKDRLYYLPENFSLGSGSSFKRVRYLRTGLFLGECVKGRFEPSQALAMNLKMNEWENCLSLSSADERTVRYLKGETLSLSPQEAEGGDGWRLVCTDGFPLGWGRGQRQMLKNKYYPGWRWQ